MPIDPVTGAAIINGLGSVTNGLFQGAQNKKNREFQAAENQKARDFNLDMWNKNNAYNDPTQQMARLKNAGINPHLAYSNGQAMNTSNAPASSNASGTMGGVAPQVDVNGIVHSMLQAKKTNAEIKVLEAEARSKDATADNTEVLTGINKITLENQAEIIATNLGVQNMQIRVGDKKIQVDDQSIKESTQRVVNMISDNENLKQKLENLKAEKQLTDQQISQVVALVGVAYAQAKNLSAQTILTSEKSRSERSWRGNIEADTRNKNELLKQMQRGNYIGDKFDLNFAENEFQLSNQQINQIKQNVNNMQKDGQLKDLNLKHGELNYLLDQVLAPATVIEGYKDAFNPLKGSSSTYKYDKKGNYQGHTTTKRSK